MSISFSRSTRSLNSDSYYVSLVALIIAAIVLAAWSAWFLFAQITLYETSREYTITREGAVLAKFSTEQMPRLRPGQSARVSYQIPKVDTPRILTAIVMDTPSRPQNRLAADTARLEIQGQAPKEGQIAEIQIEVERLTPMALVLRIGQRFMNQAPK